MFRLWKRFKTKMGTEISFVLTSLCITVVNSNSLNIPISCQRWSGYCEDIFKGSPIKSASISLWKLLSESNKFFVSGSSKKLSSNAFPKPEIRPGHPSKTSYNRILTTFISLFWLLCFQGFKIRPSWHCSVNWF